MECKCIPFCFGAARSSYQNEIPSLFSSKDAEILVLTQRTDPSLKTPRVSSPNQAKVHFYSDWDRPPPKRSQPQPTDRSHPPVFLPGNKVFYPTEKELPRYFVFPKNADSSFFLPPLTVDSLRVFIDRGDCW